MHLLLYVLRAVLCNIERLWMIFELSVSVVKGYGEDFCGENEKFTLHPHGPTKFFNIWSYSKKSKHNLTNPTDKMNIKVYKKLKTDVIASNADIPQQQTTKPVVLARKSSRRYVNKPLRNFLILFIVCTVPRHSF